MSYSIITTAAMAEVRTGDLPTVELRPAAGAVIRATDPDAMRTLADRLYDAATELEGANCE